MLYQVGLFVRVVVASRARISRFFHNVYPYILLFK
jgi:hypothetical protein